MAVASVFGLGWRIALCSSSQNPVGREIGPLLDKFLITVLMPAETLEYIVVDP